MNKTIGNNPLKSLIRKKNPQTRLPILIMKTAQCYGVEGIG